MEQSFLPAENYSMDSNREEALRQQEHTSKETGNPVQVASLDPISNPAMGRGYNGGARIRTDSQEAAESTDDSNVDVTKMREQLRDIHKDFSERRVEKGAVAMSYVQHPGEVDPDDNETYRKAKCKGQYATILQHCKYCLPKTIGDEIHFVLVYPQFQAERRLLETKIVDLYPNTMQEIFIGHTRDDTCKNCVPEYVSGISLNCQVAISNKLNAERDDYRDYNLVADAMGHSTNTIQAARLQRNPMMKIFEISGRVKGKEFVDALFIYRRFDAMKILVEHYYRVEFQQSMSHEEKRQQFHTSQAPGSPLGGSMEENMLKKAKEERKRSTSSPEEVTTPEPTNKGPTTASGQPLANASSPHRQHAFDYEDDEWANLGPEAQSFWNNIRSYSESRPHVKKLKDVKKAFKDLHKEETYLAFAYDWKLIVHALKLLPESDGEQLVTAENFRHMLAWFGPPTPDENGCMKMAGKLRAKSIRKVDDKGEKRKLSWFAGHYGMQESAHILELQEQGCFLVRFSTSFPEDGWFALALKPGSSAPEQFQIAQTRENGSRKFFIKSLDTKFDHLWDLIEYYEENKLVCNPEDDDERVSEFLCTPCPGLPLNEICTGYKTEKRSNKSGKSSSSKDGKSKDSKNKGARKK